MNFFNKYFIPFLFVAIFLASCNPEDIDEITADNPNFIPEVTDVIEGLSSTATLFDSDLGIVIDSSECLTILFPFDLEQTGGTTVTIQDQDQYDALAAIDDSLRILLPFSVYTEVDDMTTVINELPNIIEPLQACGFLWQVGPPTEPCDTEAHVQLFFNAHNIFTLYPCPFDINYPVEMFINGDATASIVSNVNDYFATSGAPSNIQPVELVYPITVVQDGVTITLNSDQEICGFIEGC